MVVLAGRLRISPAPPLPEAAALREELIEKIAKVYSLQDLLTNKEFEEPMRLLQNSIDGCRIEEHLEQRVGGGVPPGSETAAGGVMSTLRNVIVGAGKFLLAVLAVGALVLLMRYGLHPRIVDVLLN
jgi:hypothetical protein